LAPLTLLQIDGRQLVENTIGWAGKSLCPI
jgi:hypothetical protein